MELNFPDGWFDAEERDGFLISEEMKRAWAAQLETLKVISDICDQYGFHYFAYWGTLLGAVRHQGFVPWDDDMDIGMLRQDLTRFLSIAKEVLPEGYYIRSWQNDPYTDQIIVRVINGDKIDFSKEHLDKYHGCPYAVGIDIFPIDWIPDDDEEYNLQVQLIGMANTVGYIWEDETKCLAEKRYLTVETEKATGFGFDETKNIKTQATQLADAISAMYGPSDTNSLGIPLRGLYDGDQRFPKECFMTLIKQPFEITEIPIPIGYHEILTKYYGDYTEKKRYEGHDYPFYKDQKEVLENYLKEKGISKAELLGWE